MSDSEEYEYEYDESDQEAMDDGGDGGDDEEQSFDYTDDEGENQPQEDGEAALENAYYNAKSERDDDELAEARETFESVVRMEIAQNKKAAGIDTTEDNGGGEDDAMDVEEGSDVKSTTNLATPLKYHGSWSYKAIKQLVKLHLRSMDSTAIMKDYSRMFRVASASDAGISPNYMEKSVNRMLDRVSNLVAAAGSGGDGEGNGNASHVIAQNVYDLTLEAFHPTTGISPNERLWFKTNLKYGQLLYEMNETAKLQLVIRDLLISSGQPVDVLEGEGGAVTTAGESTSSSAATGSSSGGTHVMEIAALQIQLYSKLKDTKKLRAAYHRAQNVRGGIPHPRTKALIEELGGKMHMSQRNFNDASQAFFQAFKSYDEAGDRSRLRCLKYLVMASMLHASSINPFDSHEARAHRDDPEIVAMTNLVQAFHSGDIKKFEKILKKNEGRIMDDEFVREHVADLLRTIRTQVIMRNYACYTRVRLERIARDLNDIPVEDVESLLVALILDGKLDGHIDQVKGILVKKSQRLDDGEKDPATNPAVGGEDMCVESRNLKSLIELTSALEHLTTMVSKVSGNTTSKSSSAAYQPVLQ